MKRAFVTGATGFVGLNLVEILASEGWDVVALHLSGEDLSYLSRYDVKPVAGNILDYLGLTGAMPKDLDAVFHLAGDTTTWPKLADRQYNINVNGTANVCRAAMERGAGRVVVTSSSSAFGYHAERFSETTPSNALTCGINYHKTKYLAEEEVRRLVKEGLDAVMVNPCNIMGPYDTANWSQLIINVAKNRLPGAPPGVGTFAHVKDVARAHVTAVDKGRTGENYLLGGVEASFKEVIAEILAVTGVDLPLKDISKFKLRIAVCGSSIKSLIDGKEPFLSYPKYMRLVGRLSCDNSKAVKELGFSTTSIRMMVSDSYEWLKQEGLL
ncbi:MAG: NAD-dependent epimerase/dehydratase family protein [Deltaproteobacteria bacterium]|nr:NAD-dependent epimerase/dehydratase family protein [Candidatus Zymogenaceae bacterium]